MALHPGLLYRGQESGADRPLIRRSEHERVLASCVDIPEEAPEFRIPIDHVGIGNKTVWVKLATGLTPFEADIRVALPSKVKGIHMSRIEGAIADLLDTPFDDIALYAEALADRVVETQEGSRAEVILSGKIPLVQKTLATGRISVDHLELGATASVECRKDKRLASQTLRVGACHITACPCTQAYNEVLFDAPSRQTLITHSQRSTTSITVERQGGRPSVSDLFDCLASALHVTSDLLKRPDEAELVLQAHTKPQFAEDTTRQTALAFGRKFAGRLPAQTLVTVESDSLESIHIHDVRARLVTSLGEIETRLSAAGLEAP